MKKLSKDLKRALAALAHQDAGEFLSMNDKMIAIGYGNPTDKRQQTTPRLVSDNYVKKRIAVIADGRDLNFPIEYAIDACLRQNADIDLLLHGDIDKSGISIIEKHISESGIQAQRISLGKNEITKILEYVSRNSSLIFIASAPRDSIARVLMEEIIPGSKPKISVPLVLIDEKKPVELTKKSAA